GRHGWYEARERLGQTEGFLQDLAAGAASADGTALADRMVHALRHTLLYSSIITIANQIPEHFYATLVRHRLWTPIQALTYVRHISYDVKRIKALRELVPHLPEVQLDAAVMIIREVQGTLAAHEEHAKSRTLQCEFALGAIAAAYIRAGRGDHAARLQQQYAV